MMQENDRDGFNYLVIYYSGFQTDTPIVMPDNFHGISAINPAVGASLCGHPNMKKITNDPKNKNFLRKEFFYLNIWVKRNHFFMNKGRASRIGEALKGNDLSLGEIIGRFNSYATRQYIGGVKNNNWKLFYEKL